MPTLAAGDALADCLHSLETQTFDRFEVIVVDDGSTDGSIEALKQFAEFVTIVRLSSNVGVSEARSRGASLASGEYVIFLDGDDLLAPWALEVCAAIRT